jgi:alginate O-acetyltransferase complex protein AlgI
VLFPTLDYLFFLALTVGLYWGVPARLRVVVLGLASLAFYASWSVIYLPVMLLLVAVSWGGAMWLFAWRSWNGAGLRRAVVAIALLMPLFFFKYWDWVAGNFEWVLAHLNLVVELPRVNLKQPPVGISFHTFQCLAYALDIGRIKAGDAEPVERDLLTTRGSNGALPALAGAGGPSPQPALAGAERDLWRFMTFQMFFPLLVAGPITRAKVLLPQLRDMPLLRQQQIGRGLWRISKGMAKKLLVADVLAVGIVDPIFGDPGRFTGVELLFALYAYTLQIYYDFSGYSDIAIGSARLFGIEIPENFRRPYLATSVAAFWRRWHITLSDWIRDYMFFPMGGSRGSAWMIYRNTMLTLVAIGIWHGASWNFVVYGALHGVAVCINRFQQRRTGRKPDEPLPNAWAWAWRWFITFHFVVIARILFRAPDLETSWQMLEGLGRIDLVFPRFSPTSWAVFVVGYAVHFTPERWSDTSEGVFTRQHPAVWALVAAGVAAAALLMGTGEHLAFVYYQF